MQMLNIKKTCFYYYVLFCQLCGKKPVALKLSNHYFVFQDDGIYIHPFAADPYNHLPHKTWALYARDNRDSQSSSFKGGFKNGFW